MNEFSLKYSLFFHHWKRIENEEIHDFGLLSGQKLRLSKLKFTMLKNSLVIGALLGYYDAA